MDDRPDEEQWTDEAVFAPARLTRRRSPVPGIAGVAIVVVVGGLALVGIVGGTNGTPDPGPSRSIATHVRPVVTTAAERAAAKEAPWRTRPGTGEPFESRRLSFGDLGWPPRLVDAFVPVRLEQPRAGAWAVTGANVAVQGKLRVKADSVRVSLQTLDWQVLDATVVDTSNTDGGIRPLRAPAFDVQLVLPTPRPTGERIWVVVAAYDEAGGPLGMLRRLVTVGAPAT